MNYIKYGLGLFLVIVLVFNLAQKNVYVAEGADTETAVDSEDTVEADFADDCVLVVLTNEASLAVDQYDTSTFAGINCSGIKSLTQAKEIKIQEKISTISANLGEIATTANVMKIATTDEEISNYKQILCIKLEETGKDKVLEAIAELEKHEDVLYAGPDYFLTACATTVTANDTYYSSQWAIDKISLPSAWYITTGSSSVKVAVIDSGIDGDHPDLESRIDTSLCMDFTSGTGVAVGTPVDDNGHGTAVAGIIGAVGNNETGVCGTCWDVTLVSLKVLDSDLYGYSSDALAAIDYAESQNIPIINFSVGWYAHNETYYDEPLYTVISNYSGLFVCAAGNATQDNDTKVFYPSYYDLPNMIVVGASNESDQKWNDSNYGKNTVDLFAPGSNIYTTCYDSTYDTFTATSFATPYVTGTAALLLSKYPNMAVLELKKSILQNADIVYDSTGNSVFGELCTSGGRLNAYRALTNVAHSYTYTNQNLYVGHNCVCSTCGYACLEKHTWNTGVSPYRCTKCGLTSTFIPASVEDEVSE